MYQIYIPTYCQYITEYRKFIYFFHHTSNGVEGESHDLLEEEARASCLALTWFDLTRWFDWSLTSCIPLVDICTESVHI